jgi:predicted ATPase
MSPKNRRQFGLKNFKVFKDFERLEIAPITILTGTNSSGKSSFVKAARLLKENFKSDEDNYDKFSSLNFQFSNVHLGGFEKVFSSLSNLEKEESKKIYFKTNIENPVFDGYEIIIVYKNDSKGGFENGVLDSLHLVSSDQKSKLLSLYAIDIEYDRNKKEKTTSSFWGLEINVDIWIKRLYELASEHESQFKILKLKEYIWELISASSKSDFYSKMDKEHKDLYDELIAKGITPIDKDIEDEIDLYQGFFDEESQKKSFAFYTVNDCPLNWNYVAENLHQKFQEYNLLLDYPLFGRPEWDINFDQNGDFICDSLNDNDLYKISDFNHEIFYKISQALLDNNIRNKKDVEVYFKEKEKEIIKEFFKGKLAASNYFVHKSRSERELKNTLTEYLKGFFSIETIAFDMPENPKEIVDFRFFDNIFPDHFMRNYKPFLFAIESDVDNLKEKWKPFQNSFKFLVNLVYDVIKDAFKAFSDFGDIIFIDTQRDLNQRIFLDKDDTEFNKSMREYINLKSKISQNDKLINFSARKQFITKWIKLFEICENFVIERDSEGIGTRAYLINKHGKELLVDVGFGVNKLFSLILKVAVSPKDSTIFIEEPESNLHPAMQSKLADLLVDAHQLFGHHFVLETHSEYLIRKLQFLVASEKSTAKAEDINIYYLFHPDKVPKGRKQVEKLEMREDGILKQDFGKGFFDESVMLTLELLRNQKSN